METLKRRLPYSGHEGINELNKIAVRFEEKIFSAASSQVTIKCLANVCLGTWEQLRCFILWQNLESVISYSVCLPAPPTPSLFPLLFVPVINPCK